jgi:hypothetical protein
MSCRGNRGCLTVSRVTLTVNRNLVATVQASIHSLNMARNTARQLRVVAVPATITASSTIG